MKKLMWCFIFIFALCVFVPGTASALDLKARVNTVSVGITTAPLPFMEHSVDDLINDIKFDVEVDASLIRNVFLLGEVGADAEFQITKSKLSDLNSFNQETFAYRAFVYAQPVSWFRTGPILRDGLVEYSVRVGYPRGR